MAQKNVTREIIVVDKSGTFGTLFKKFTGENESFDFEGLSALRRLLSNEKARILHTIKEKKPKSIYELSRLVGRNFKAVSEDIKLLERFSLIELVLEKTGKRTRLKPILTAETISITIRI